MRKKLLVLAAVFTLSLGIMTGCGAKDSNNSATSPSGSADTMEKTPDDSGRSEEGRSDGSVLDDTVDGAGDVVDDAGDVVRDAGDAVGDAVDDATDDMDGQTGKTTGDQTSGTKK